MRGVCAVSGGSVRSDRCDNCGEHRWDYDTQSVCLHCDFDSINRSVDREVERRRTKQRKLSRQESAYYAAQSE